jgi:DNA polymerase (family 10)
MNKLAKSSIAKKSYKQAFNIDTALSVFHELEQILHPFTLRPVGSVRRECAKVNDLDILVIDTPLENINAILSTFDFLQPIISGSTKSSWLDTRNLLQIDFNHTRSSQLPYALLHHTGSKMHNIIMRARAKEKGLKLNQYGLFDQHGFEVLYPQSEYDIFSYLDLDYKKPQDRH